MTRFLGDSLVTNLNSAFLSPEPSVWIGMGSAVRMSADAEARFTGDKYIWVRQA